MIYRRMKRNEWKFCADLAAKAFEDYDFFSAYVPSDRKRPVFLKYMLRTEFYVNQGRSDFFVAWEDDRIAAIAVVRRTSYRMPDVDAYLKAGFWKCLVVGGVKHTAAWYNMDLEAGKPCQGIDGNTWFLHLLAVDSAKKGKGVGSRMLSECIIPYVKKRGGETLCLYTNSEINRKFYIKNGFREFDEMHFAYGGKAFGSWSYRMDFV